MPGALSSHPVRAFAARLSLWLFTLMVLSTIVLSGCGGGGGGPSGNTSSGSVAALEDPARTQLRLRRQAAVASSARASINQAPTWAPSTAYVPSDVVRLSSGQLLIASTGGTSGASEPGFSATDPIVDGAVTWQALDELTQVAGVGAPVVVVADVAGISALPVQHNFLLDAASFAQPTAPNVEAVAGAGANTRTRAWSIVDGSTNDNGHGANGRLGKYRTIEFETDADVIEIGYFAITAGFTQERLRVWVNDHPVSEAPLVPSASGGSRYFRLSITTPDSIRRIRIASSGTMLLSYVAVGAGHTVTPPAQRSLMMAFVSDSFFDTESPSVPSVHHDLGVLVAEKTGFPHCVSWGLGGTSYSVDSSGRKALQTLLTLNSLASFQPDAVVIGHGYNAPSNGVTAANEATAAEASWRAIRSQAPDAPIMVVGTWYLQPSYVTQQAAIQSALKARFLLWRDANAVFIDPHDGSITRGDGTVIRAPGAAWFNPSNVSWAFPPTGGDFDGFHPSTQGAKQVLLPSMVDAIDTALVAMGY